MEIVPIFQQPIHPLAIQTCQILQNAGYQAYIVGGCVRDLHLGVAPKDWDITSDATPQQVMSLFPKNIPTGLQHGTVTVCMGEGVENHFEITTFRVEGKYTDGRRPEEVRFVSSLKEDLARRDFTINAMAYDPVSHIRVDPFGGLEDLQNGIIRAVGDANARFQEDGLRIMRAARFAARFRYKIEDKTLQGMKDNLETLKKVSKERINDELSKTLMTDYPDTGFFILFNSGALDVCSTLLGKSQSEKNTMVKLHRCRGELETRLAYLYNKFSSKLVERDLLDLKFSNKEVKKVCFLLDRLTEFRMFQTNPSIGSYKLFIAKFKNDAPDTWERAYKQFVGLSEALFLPIRDMLEPYRKEVVFARKELAINGDDLMAAGVVAGPNLKVLLDSAYQEILEHPEHNEKEYLLQMLLRD